MKQRKPQVVQTKTETYVGIGVQILTDDGNRSFLSFSSTLLPTVFGYSGARKKAVEHKKKCAEHGISLKQMKVVRVKATIEYEDKFAAR